MDIVGIEVESDAGTPVPRTVAVGEEVATMPPTSVERSTNFAAGDIMLKCVFSVKVMRRMRMYDEDIRRLEERMLLQQLEAAIKNRKPKYRSQRPCYSRS